MAGSNIYETDLGKVTANYTPLSPITFIERTASIFPDRASVIHGDTRYTWSETYARCRRLASALVRRGIGTGDTVAIMAPNVPAIFEANFGVPMAGAVLNSLNFRLDSPTVKYILEHSETKLLITDREFSDIVEVALADMDNPPVVIDIDDALHEGGKLIGEKDYEALLAEGDPEFVWSPPADEWQAISLNYTSGTTGNPKGVVYHHRGAFINALGNAVTWSMPAHPTYLWTLPMFHASGWCFPWTITAIAGTHICLRRVEAPAIFDAIEKYKVSHLCGAPVVLGMLINASQNDQRSFDHTVNVMTAASPPPAAVIAAMENMGFKITHVYGLTEVFGPAVVCAWHEEWNDLPVDEQANLKSRQGVRYPVLDGLMVADPDTLEPVPSDGETMGEVFFRGNLVMKGYLKNKKATDEAFAGGWFHSGDLGVLHPDGYIELKDRSKDIIISGGENISSIEIENALYKHPAVLEAAVIARPDEKWGETPCAFVALKDGINDVGGDEIIQFCRDNMAGYKVPKTVVFGPLPKTSTGKVQKFLLRDRVLELTD